VAKLALPNIEVIVVKLALLKFEHRLGGVARLALPGSGIVITTKVSYGNN
jgi:hypothetical protein